MAAAEIVAADIDLMVHESSPSNIDEQEGEMQVFVQQHLLSLFQPVNATLQDLQEQMNRLRTDVLQRHVSIDESLHRVDVHENCLQNLFADLGTTNQKASRMHMEVTQMMELQAKATRERLETTSAKLDDQMLDLSSRTCALEAWKLEAGQGDDGHIGQLQAGMDDFGGRTKQLEKDMAEMQKTFEEMHHCNLGLSQRAEQAKMKLDSASKDLYKVMAQSTHQAEESKLNHAHNKAMMKDFSERMVVACFDIQGQGTRLSAAEENVKKLWKEVGEVENHLETMNNNDQGNQAKIHEEMKELQKMDARTAIAKLSMVVDDIDARLTTISEGASPMVHTELGKLTGAADSASRSIASHDTNLDKLNAHSQHADNRLKNIEDTQSDHGNQLEQSLARADTHANDIKDHRASISANFQKWQIQEQDLQSLDVRTQRCEKGVDSNGASLNSLIADFATTTQKIALNSNRVNLAHGCLRGMTKGISEAQKRAGDGLEGMISPEKLRGPEENRLPELPGSPPRRPATSMT